jgi:hypothetical protein
LPFRWGDLEGKGSDNSKYWRMALTRKCRMCGLLHW